MSSPIFRGFIRGGATHRLAMHEAAQRFTKFERLRQTRVMLKAFRTVDRMDALTGGMLESCKSKLSWTLNRLNLQYPIHLYDTLKTETLLGEGGIDLLREANKDLPLTLSGQSRFNVLTLSSFPLEGEESKTWEAMQESYVKGANALFHSPEYLQERCHQKVNAGRKEFSDALQQVRKQVQEVVKIEALYYGIEGLSVDRERLDQVLFELELLESIYEENAKILENVDAHARPIAAWVHNEMILSELRKCVAIIEEETAKRKGYVEPVPEAFDYSKLDELHASIQQVIEMKEPHGLEQQLALLEDCGFNPSARMRKTAESWVKSEALANESAPSAKFAVMVGAVLLLVALINLYKNQGFVETGEEIAAQKEDLIKVMRKTDSLRQVAEEKNPDMKQSKMRDYHPDSLKTLIDLRNSGRLPPVLESEVNNLEREVNKYLKNRFLDCSEKGTKAGVTFNKKVAKRAKHKQNPYFNRKPNAKYPYEVFCTEQKEAILILNTHEDYSRAKVQYTQALDKCKAALKQLKTEKKNLEADLSQLQIQFEEKTISAEQFADRLRTDIIPQISARTFNT